MAEGLNQGMLLGDPGADPELRTTQSGTAVLKLRLATTERYLDANKAWQERTEWHSVIVWGKRGEALHRYLTKGSQILVLGGLRTSSYEDKEGIKRYKTEVVANDVKLCGGRPGGRRDGDGSSEAPATRNGRSAPAGGGQAGGTDQQDFGYAPPGETGDDDIAF